MPLIKVTPCYTKADCAITVNVFQGLLTSVNLINVVNCGFFLPPTTVTWALAWVNRCIVKCLQFYSVHFLLFLVNTLGKTYPSCFRILLTLPKLMNKTTHCPVSIDQINVFILGPGNRPQIQEISDCFSPFGAMRTRSLLSILRITSFTTQ